jgi:acyl-CoA reductase-like NAD-dependent aldehyde dehydrogenase
VVFDDADLPSAVNGVSFAAFVASGQTCVSGTRLILSESIYDEFMTAFIEKVKTITAGIGDRTFLPHSMASDLRFCSLQPEVNYGNSDL